MASSSDDGSLKVHEWLAVVLILSIFSFLIINTAAQPARAVLPVPSASSEFEVFVRGAVAYPGIYRLPSPLLLGEILEIAGVEPDADLRRFNKNQKVQRSRQIKVPLRAMIAVEVRGALALPGSYRLPKGSTLGDLFGQLSLPADADLRAFRLTSKLKDGQIIEIPAK